MNSVICKMLVKPVGLFTALILLTNVLISTLSCASQPATTPYNYFKASSSYAEISGYSAGYMPGDSAIFTIGLKNPTEQTIQGEFCLLLIDEEGVVTTLIDKRPYTVNPESSFTSPEPITFPSTLQEGAYGLALLLPNSYTSVTNIWIGSGTPQSGGTWPEITSCPD